MSKARTKSKARRYPSSEGTWLNVHAIEEQFSINRWTFYYNQRHGWPQRDGRPLEAKSQKCGRRQEDTFLESEVAALCPSVTITGRYEVRGKGIRLTRTRAMKELSVSGFTLSKYRKCCRYLKNQPLLFELTKSPETNKWEETCAEEDVRQIKEARRLLAGDRHQDQEGVWWITASRAI
jgi:hypothetical protein